MSIKGDLSTGEHKRLAFLELNSKGKVPLMAVDGQPVFESLAAVDLASSERPALARA